MTTFVGTLGDDDHTAIAGEDAFYGLDGNDTLTATTAGSIIYGGNGNDSLRSSFFHSDAVYGGEGNDAISGYDAILAGEGGDDAISGSGGIATAVKAMTPFQRAGMVFLTPAQVTAAAATT